jgi:uncharacterized protein YPO0396
MHEHELDLGISHSGYRLSRFQVYNWGTFSDHVVNLDLRGKNTLLTGSNGSGKTTLVDALLTLLVPSDMRTYNLSSGQDGKAGRTEESYVLGAYSTTKGENDYAASKEYLRDKGCHSILIGQFENDNAPCPITLLQIRYFSANGSLQRIFAICDGTLSLQAMAERDVAFDGSTGWKKRLLKAFADDCKIVFFDTFKGYSAEFSARFGFRDRDKALRIFSQTVGMKDLSNLNEFIRTRMLVEMDMVEEFSRTLANFENLLGTKRTIEKEEEQIRRLKEIEQVSGQYLSLDTKYTALQIDQRCIPLWEARQASRFLEGEIERLFAQKQDLEQRLAENRLQADEARSGADELQRTLSADKRVEREEELKRQRQWLAEKLSTARLARERYETASHALGIPSPDTDAAFSDNLAQAKLLEQQIERKLETIEDDRIAMQGELAESRRELAQVSAQLQAIGDRDSNIPWEYLEIREAMCKMLGLEESGVPFLGELVRLRQDCLAWEEAANALLRPWALTLLVQPYQKEAVAEYLWNHEIGHGLGFCVIKEGCKSADEDERHQLALIDDSQEVFFEEENVPTRLDLMLETREDCPFAPFVRELLSRAVPYERTESLSGVLEGENRFGDMALAHGDGRWFKGATAKDQDLQILGWDAREKKQRIGERLHELEESARQAERVLVELKSEQRHQTTLLEACRRLQEFRSYEEIDTGTLDNRLSVLDDQLFALKSEMDDLNVLRDRLERTRAVLQRLESEMSDLYRQQGSNDSRLADARQDKMQYDDLLASNMIGIDARQLSCIAERYQVPDTFEGITQIRQARAVLESGIDTRLQEMARKREEARKRVEGMMDRLVHPGTKISQAYPTWDSDFADFPSDIEGLDMYLEMLRRLEEEDLPRYKTQFATMRLRQTKTDIINFNTALRRWERHIRENIAELNESLSALIYQQHPQTKIRLTAERVNDRQIKMFNQLLGAAIPDAGAMLGGSEQEEELANRRFFEAANTLLTTLKEDDQFCRKVLDVRRWFVFAVEEYDTQTGAQVRYYQDSAGISGGQKAKLAYTILAAAIAHQFDVFDCSNVSRSFRFVIVDEAFSKSDDENSRYAMDLFSKMDLQLMVVTPKDKVNLVEPYIDSVQITVCNDGIHSYMHSLTKDQLHESLEETS